MPHRQYDHEMHMPEEHKPRRKLVKPHKIKPVMTWLFIAAIVIVFVWIFFSLAAVVYRT